MIQIEEAPVLSVIAYAKNAREHSEAQVTALAESIKAFGFNNPCLIDADGVLIAGHGRVLAAQRLGMSSIPVIRLGHLTPDQVKAYRIADNRLPEGSTWNDDLLRLELGELEMAGFDLSLTGFDLSEFTDHNTGPGLGSLAAEFGVPPFSVLSARDGWWQDRKRAWLALGIQSELGRGESAGNKLTMSDTKPRPPAAGISGRMQNPRVAVAVVGRQ